MSLFSTSLVGGFPFNEIMSFCGCCCLRKVPRPKSEKSISEANMGGGTKNPAVVFGSNLADLQLKTLINIVFHKAL